MRMYSKEDINKIVGLENEGVKCLSKRMLESQSVQAYYLKKCEGLLSHKKTEMLNLRPVLAIMDNVITKVFFNYQILSARIVHKILYQIIDRTKELDFDLNKDIPEYRLIDVLIKTGKAHVQDKKKVVPESLNEDVFYLDEGVTFIITTLAQTLNMEAIKTQSSMEFFFKHSVDQKVIRQSVLVGIHKVFENPEATIEEIIETVDTVINENLFTDNEMREKYINFIKEDK